MAAAHALGVGLLQPGALKSPVSALEPRKVAGKRWPSSSAKATTSSARAGAAPLVQLAHHRQRHEDAQAAVVRPALRTVS